MVKAKLGRRALLRASVLSSGAVLAGFGATSWLDAFPASAHGGERRLASGEKRIEAAEDDPLASGKQVGMVDFIHEGQVEVDVAHGEELDGRLYTDLRRLRGQSSLTPTEYFYVRTRASSLLPEAAGFRIPVSGLVGRPFSITAEELRGAAQSKGEHVMECAGNVRLTRFGMISAASWSGFALSQILDNTRVTSRASGVLVSGFDRYARESATSVPGASWIFALDELKQSGAFLATEMNSEPLTRDHGAPVRLVVPGWYGCSCIKWVESITLVDEKAEATSQMLEYAARTMQNGAPRLAKDYQPAVIDQAAMPIRIEKWVVGGKIKYRVVGIVWGGSRPVKILQIRFNPEEDYVNVANFNQTANDPWTVWSHIWTPREPGTYTIRLTVKEPHVRTRRLDSGYYARTVEITEI